MKKLVRVFQFWLWEMLQMRKLKKNPKMKNPSEKPIRNTIEGSVRKASKSLRNKMNDIQRRIYVRQTLKCVKTYILKHFLIEIGQMPTRYGIVRWENNFVFPITEKVNKSRKCMSVHIKIVITVLKYFNIGIDKCSKWGN